MIDLTGLVRGFADLLRPEAGHADRLSEWISTPRAADLPHHNGGTEGVNTKTKRIMRQMHGRAGFPLPRHRILLG
jgi:hypothetical protein